MGFLDHLMKALRGQTVQGSGGGGSSFGADPNVYWIYAQCQRCGEALKARVNLANDPSPADDGEGWIVRKQISGSGANRCFATVEVTLTFDAKKRNVSAASATGGKVITVEEYERLSV